jgi:hypothetical protein
MDDDHRIGVGPFKKGREIAFTDPLTGAPRCFTSRRSLQATQEAATPA